MFCICEGSSTLTPMSATWSVRIMLMTVSGTKNMYKLLDMMSSFGSLMLTLDLRYIMTKSIA